jgi:hypothetical protein
VLCAYFDESGEHDKATGREVQMSLGGCLASEESWERFSKEWAAALPTGMDMFHMTDFENRRDLCAGWDRQPRHKFLNTLLDIMGRHAIQFFGVTSKFVESEDHFSDGYREGLLEAIFNVTGCAKALGESRIALVFAHQPKFKCGKIERVFGEINQEDTQLCSIATGDPRDIKPLQAADIIAYETMRFHRNPDDSFINARYPWRKLGTYNVPIAIEWALRPKKSDSHQRFSARRHFELLRNTIT